MRITKVIGLLICMLLPAAAFATPMQWTNEPLTFSLQDKIMQFDIKVWQSPKGDAYYVTSNNIMMQCQPLVSDFEKFDKQSHNDLKRVLDKARALKAKDDQLSYNKSASTLIRESNDRGYFGSEQHVVYAFIASARTGFRISPEFFIESDAFGGTAGNGPEVTAEGGTGERNSTVAMAHDADWILGRYFASGPLKKLSAITPTKQYQIKRMGSFGLMNAGAAQAMNNTGIVLDSKEHATNDTIAKELDRLDKDSNYTSETWLLKQGIDGWKTKFRTSFMKEGRSGFTWNKEQRKNYGWDGTPPANTSEVDICGLVQLREPCVVDCKDQEYSQSVHIFGGSGTDPEQNDLMKNLYDWIPANKNKKVIARYYTGIGVMDAKHHEWIYNKASENICSDIAKGVDDIYLFGFSRGAILAADLADVERHCDEAIAQRKVCQPKNFNAQNLVKFVGLVDPVNTSIPQYSTRLPNYLGRSKRSLVVQKAHHQGLGDTALAQQFYFDSKERIRVFGDRCLTAKNNVVELDICNDGPEQKFGKLYDGPNFRVWSRYKDRFIHLHYGPTGAWYEFNMKDLTNSGMDQLFKDDPEVKGRVRLAKKENANDCWTIQDWSRDRGKDLHKAACVPDENNKLTTAGILSTTTIQNVAETQTVKGLWHQDLQCTLNVTDDGLSYATNASEVEKWLIWGARGQGLDFSTVRPRTNCRDWVKQGEVKIWEKTLP